MDHKELSSQKITELQILPLGSSGKILPPLGFLTKAGNFIAIDCNTEAHAKVKRGTTREYYINKAAGFKCSVRIPLGWHKSTHTLLGK